MKKSSHSWVLAFGVVDSVEQESADGQHFCHRVIPHNCVLMLSKGVTANRDSVAPAKNPAITVAGPDTVPSAPASIVLY
jgi:hypothetical protein